MLFKLQFRLEKFENALVLQTLFLESKFKGVLDWTASNGVTLRSNKTTDLNQSRIDFIGSTDDRIYFSGTVSSKDCKVAVRNFEDNLARDSFYDNALSAVKEWAEADYPITNPTLLGSVMGGIRNIFNF